METSLCPREDRRDQRQEARQVRGQVDVHVGHDVGVAREPRGPECVAAALAGEREQPHLLVPPCELCGDRAGAVRACVVGDHDPEAEGILGPEVGDQLLDVGAQRPLLVVHGRDNVDCLESVHASN